MQFSSCDHKWNSSPKNENSVIVDSGCVDTDQKKSFIIFIFGWTPNLTFFFFFYQNHETDCMCEAHTKPGRLEKLLLCLNSSNINQHGNSVERSLVTQNSQSVWDTWTSTEPQNSLSWSVFKTSETFFMFVKTEKGLYHHWEHSGLYVVQQHHHHHHHHHHTVLGLVKPELDNHGQCSRFVTFLF